MIITDVASDGANGADGVAFGESGEAGGGGDVAALLGLPFGTPANEAVVRLTAFGGRGGAGGAGAGGDSGGTGDAGAGGAGGLGGGALVLIQDLLFATAVDASVERTAWADGGDGGQGGLGGDAGPVNDAFGGDGGAAGEGGVALAEVVGVEIEGQGTAVLDVNLSARAEGGVGGNGADGGDSFLGSNGSDSASGDGGDATARVSGVEAALAGLEDTFVIDATALGGDAGNGVLERGEGGTAAAVLSANRVRMGGGGDLLIAQATAEGGAGDTGGSDGAESIDFSDNLFDLGDGSDFLSINLTRGDGSETVLSGNVFYGGAGSDLLTFNISTAVVFDYKDNKVKGFETVVGGMRDDRLSAGRDADRLVGGSGDDALDGRAGNDTLTGAANNDTLNGRTGDDTLNGGAGDDVIDGGKGVDILFFTGGVAVTADLEAGTATGEGNDQLRRIEHLWGHTQADTLTGDRRANILIGGGGDDTLNGGGGKDTLDGRDGQDVLDGGDGGDTYVFSWYADSPEAAPDTVAGWGRHDVLDLSGIDADRTVGGLQHLAVAVGAPSGAPASGVLYVIDTGPTVELHADTDGDGLYDFAVLVQTDKTITAADLVV